MSCFCVSGSVLCFDFENRKFDLAVRPESVVISELLNQDVDRIRSWRPDSRLALV